MPFSLRAAALALIALSALALAACAVEAPLPPASPDAPAAEGFPVTVRDSAGREHTFETAPARIVSLSPGITEILFAIGAGDRVVGTDSFSNYPPEVDDLPKVAYSSPDLEQLVALEPDLVIVADRQASVVPELEQVGVRAIQTASPSSIAGVYESIVDLGRITGHAQEAEDIVELMQRRIAAVEEAIADIDEGPTYYYELDSLLFTITADTFVGEQLAVLKARNIIEDAERPFPQVSQEEIIAANPEVIFLSNAPPTGDETFETVSARPGWHDIAAIRNQRVYPVDGDLTSRPGPRIVEAIELMAAYLYPERFGQ